MNSIRFPCKGYRAAAAMVCGAAWYQPPHAGTQPTDVAADPPR